MTENVPQNFIQNLAYICHLQYFAADDINARFIVKKYDRLLALLLLENIQSDQIRSKRKYYNI